MCIRDSPWRLGGYAGIGSSPVSNSYGIKTYEDKNGEPGYQSADEANDLQEVSNRFRVNARLNFLMGAMTFEYVIPIYRDLEVRSNIGVHRQIYQEKHLKLSLSKFRIIISIYKHPE